jgi:protein TonB
MTPLAAEHRLLLGSLLLSLGLHLGLAGLGVMTGWGRILPPPPVLQVKLVAPSGGGGGGPGSSEKAGSARVAPAVQPSRPKPQPPVPHKVRLAQPVPRKEEVLPPPPKTVPSRLALATPARPPSPGPPVLPGSQIRPGSSGAGAGSASVSAVGSGSGSGVGPGAPGAGHAGGPGGGAGAPSQYFSLIRARILAHRHYPQMARQRQQEGVVRVRFSLSAAGALCQGVEVVRPSGFTLLDEQARECVQAAAPFPPIPSDLKRDRLTVEVPIVYKLTGKD